MGNRSWDRRQGASDAENGGPTLISRLLTGDSEAYHQGLQEGYLRKIAKEAEHTRQRAEQAERDRRNAERRAEYRERRLSLGLDPDKDYEKEAHERRVRGRSSIFDDLDALCSEWGQCSTIYGSRENLQELLREVVTGPRAHELVKLLGEDLRHAHTQVPYGLPQLLPGGEKSCANEHAKMVTVAVGIGVFFYSVLALFTDLPSFGFILNHVIVLSAVFFIVRRAELVKFERLNALFARASRLRDDMKKTRSGRTSGTTRRTSSRR
jgi:hypothetical protein